ncbi:hypothetical protein GCM10018781_15090 [Kitasatospora indigofera]|uniref:Uncharacterized protein n=1 Tax=Kitasatospora indigofera TaxID=67307 RepID=A0A919FFH3_9ACTN|nr:hypothetical protein GCM10018781_15090 [Kitasatospora indigofera]
MPGAEPGRPVRGPGGVRGTGCKASGRDLDNGGVNDNDTDLHTRQLLVLPDRDAADEVAEDLSARRPSLGDLDVVRDALAGEDDAEDAQWLVVVEPPETGWTTDLLAELDALAVEYQGWREEG